MSRGPGHVQRACLDYLTNDTEMTTCGGLYGFPETTYPKWRQSSEIAAVVYGTDQLTLAQRESVRRALRHLWSNGRIERSARKQQDRMFEPYEAGWSRLR